MITKNIAKEVLNTALSTGGDYAEIYVEETKTLSIRLEGGKTEAATRSLTLGAGIRILNGLKSVYGYTSDLSKKGLVSLAATLAASYQGERKITVESIKKGRFKTNTPIDIHLQDVPTEEKISWVKKGSDAAYAHDSRIIRVIGSWFQEIKKIELFNAEGSVGTFFDNFEERGRLVYSCVARDGNNMESNSANHGASAGWAWFQEHVDPVELAKQSASNAITLLSAKECPSGRFPVVIGNGWGGVLFHESCGHPLEAEATAKKLSVFSDSLGKPIASSIVSAIDDGTLLNEWGSNNIDSEGVATHKNQLIKDGICVGFLVDKLNGRRLGMEPNGTSRRESYRIQPTSRMSNTYICPGKDNPEDIIKDTKLGIYVVGFNGGSVDPVSGEFNFTASVAYAIRDGKIAEPLKGCTLIGSGQEVLHNIDRVGNDLAHGQGMCGASSGLIPVNVGQPTIRLSSITVGGRGGESL